MVAKIRPCLVLSIRPELQDRALVTLVPHTTSVRGTRFEIAVPKAFLKSGAFDAQGLVTLALPRLIRKLGDLQSGEIAQVELSVRKWLEI
jgi:mRNA interferase MazF